jgi:hypothetical protein
LWGRFREEGYMSGKACAVILAAAAAVLVSGCGMFKKEGHMIPTPSGWVEEESKHGGDTLKYKPAEKVKVKYDY